MPPASDRNERKRCGNGSRRLRPGRVVDRGGRAAARRPAPPPIWRSRGTGNALSALGLTGNTGTGTSFNAGRTAAPGSLSGKTLTFTSFNGGTAINVTFGDGSSGTVKTLDQLNAALLANNLRRRSTRPAS